LLAFASISACSTEIVQRPQPPPVDWQSLEPQLKRSADSTPIAASTKERSTARVYTDALASMGCAKLASALDEEAHFVFAGGRDTRGRDRVVQAHDAIFADFDARTVAVDRVLLTDSSQAVEWTMRARHRANGNSALLHGLALLWTKDDGSIIDVHLYLGEIAGKGEDGAAEAPVVFEQARSVVERASVDLVRASLQALEDNNEPAYLATMAENVEVIPIGSASWRGRSEARGYFHAMRKAIGYLATSIENIWGVGSFVAVEYHVLGEQNATLVKMSTIDVVEIEDGKMVRVWRYGDGARELRR
jgi:ketosteroid isomerase-like protein